MKRYIKTICFSMMLMFSTSAMAQNKVVTGTVIDDLGEPVIGATVRVEGTKIATVTDFDGNYKIEVPEKGKIVISYIGYKDATTTGGRLQLESDSNDLEEVVVVGYGTQKKAHLTGSVGTVDMNDAAEITAGSLGATLSGLVNGLSVDDSDSKPGARAELYIRDAKSQAALKGYNATTNGSTEPLYVIDGYIYPNDVKVGNDRQNLGAEAFSNLDASEVESISVLKDAAAAVYGARAANGVILVTTKKGKLGAPRISYSGSFGITNEVSRPKMLSAYNFGRLYNIITARDPKNASLSPQSDLFQADELEAMKSLNYDLLDKYWKTGYTMKHSVNVSGATDNVSYFGGIGYFKQDGNLGNLDYDRWNYRAGMDVKISKWLSANINISGDYGKKNSPYISDGQGGDDYYRLLYRPTYYPEYVNGHPLLPYGPNTSATSSRNTYHYDLLQNHSGDFSKNSTSNININAGIKYDFGWIKALEGLKISFTYSKSIYNSKTNQYGSNYSLYEMTNRYGSGRHLYTPTAGDDPTFDYLDESNFNERPQDNGNFLSRQMMRTDNYQMNLTLQYARKFGLHDISALFSIEKSEAETEWNLSAATEPYEFTNYQYSGVDKTNTVTTVNFSRTESGMLSYIGRLNYSYADKYLFEFLLRSDASTKFAPENYWGTFPTFSLGWVMSEEPWFQKTKWLKWIDFLKIRTSYGITGRDNIAAWQWQAHYNLDANKGSIFGEGKTISSGGRITMNKESAAYNPDIKWSKSYKFNLGLDFRFLRQRLSATFDYYHERNRDILLSYQGSVQSVVGNKSAPFNYGAMNNWGWELSLTWRDTIGKDFKYHVGLNTGWSDNKVLEQEWETNPNAMYKAVMPGHRTDVGTWGFQCLGMFRTFHDIDQYFEEHLKNPETGEYGTYLGLTKDEVRPGMLIYKDVRGAYDTTTGKYADKDYKITAEDEVQLSTRSNNIYGFTINAGAEWKGISLSLQFAANWGAYTTVAPNALKAPTAYSTDFYNMPSFWNPDNIFVYEDIVDGEGNVIQKANLDGYLPNPGYSVNTSASSFWRISAARVSLNRLTLAYSIPKSWLKGIGIQNARISITGQNLLNFYNDNPDDFYNPLAGSYGNYPNLRKWNIGINLGF